MENEEQILQHLEYLMSEIKTEKERIVKSGKFEEAAALRDTERKLMEDIQKLKTPKKALNMSEEKAFYVDKLQGDPEIWDLHQEKKAHGLRYNDGKLKWSYVHFQSMEPMVRVLMFGAQKYEPRNWQRGLNKEEILESMQRHLAKMMDGEENDPESGLSHIGHIMCNAMFWSYMDLRDKKKINEKS